MRKTTLLGPLILTLALCGCVQQPAGTPAAASAPAISMTTDRSAYFERETMVVNISVIVPTDMNVTLDISGIKSSRGNYVLSEQREVNLRAFQPKNVSASYTLPSCSACAGISPGNYNISARLLQGNKALAECNATITLMKR